MAIQAPAQEGALFALKNVSFSPGTPRANEAFMVAGSIDLFHISFLGPLWVLISITYPKNLLEKILPIIPSGVVSHTTVAIGGKFSATFAEGLSQEGKYPVEIRVYAGPTAAASIGPLETVSIPPGIPPVTHYETTLTVSGKTSGGTGGGGGVPPPGEIAPPGWVGENIDAVKTEFKVNVTLPPGQIAPPGWVGEDMVAAKANFQATVSLSPSPSPGPAPSPVAPYTLTLQADPFVGGWVTSEPSNPSYYGGAFITLSAHDIWPYKFQNWTNSDGFVLSDAYNFQFTMPWRNEIVTAHYSTTTPPPPATGKYKVGDWLAVTGADVLFYITQKTGTQYVAQAYAADRTTALGAPVTVAFSVFDDDPNYHLA